MHLINTSRLSSEKSVICSGCHASTGINYALHPKQHNVVFYLKMIQNHVYDSST